MSIIVNLSEMEMNLTNSEKYSTEMDLPIDMQFNDGHVVSIITYSVLMVISAIGNITVLVLICQRRRTSRTRINTMLMHLAIADLFVSICFASEYFYLILPSKSKSHKLHASFLTILAFYLVFLCESFLFQFVINYSFIH